MPTRFCTLASALTVVLPLLQASALAQGTAKSPSKAEAAASPQQSVKDLSLEQLLGMEAESAFGASKFLQKITEAPAVVTVVTARGIERYG